MRSIPESSSLTTDTIISSVVCPGGGEMFRYGQLRFLFHRSEVLAESVAEPTSSFAHVMFRLRLRRVQLNCQKLKFSSF